MCHLDPVINQEDLKTVCYLNGNVITLQVLHNWLHVQQ